MWRSNAWGVRKDPSARHPGQITSYLMGSDDANSEETIQAFLADRK